MMKIRGPAFKDRWDWADAFLWGGLAVAAASCGVSLVAAWHWPLVGDSALMRYVVFLLHAGMAPYRQVMDVNLPGSYALEALAMRVFGAGVVGLRLYDGALCGLVCIGAVVLSERGWRGRVCGAMAGLLFMVIHLRDGVVQAGQRDLAMAVMAIAALVLLLRVRWAARVVGFELLLGMTLVVKPTLFPMALLPILHSRLRRERLSWPIACGGGCAVLAPAAAVWWWLWRCGSVGAFWMMLRGVERTHAELAHKSAGFLLAHAAGPVALTVPLVAVTWALLRFEADAEFKVLAAAAGCGLISYLLQHKGFPYQRYPFLAFALILAFRVVARGTRMQGWAQWAALATAAVSCLWFAPRFARNVQTFDSRAPFEQALSADLARRDVSAGDVQCLDTVGGCVATLNQMGLRQSTGYLYDCYAYMGSDKARADYRSAFLAAIENARPRVIVLSSQYCLEANGDQGRVQRWPELDRVLTTDYRVDGQWKPAGPIRWWNREEMPPSYRIYVRR